MKYIFDFDDVLFYNTKQLKERMYMYLGKAGIPRSTAEAYYKTVRMNQFKLKDFLRHFSVDENIYKNILEESKDFINKELVAFIKKMGRKNCYIVTYGDKEHQLDKIKVTGVETLVSRIIITEEAHSKKEEVENICAKHKDEKVVFIDDKAIYFEDLDFKKYPNLQTILYVNQSVEDLLREINN